MTKIVPARGQRVQCLIRGGGTVEGTVETWSDHQSVLRSLDGRHLFLIAHTEADIVLTSLTIAEPEVKSTVREQLHKVQQPTGDPELDQTNIHDLQRLLIEQEKKIITEKVKDHFGDKTKPYAQKYDMPGFLKKEPK